MRLFQHYQICLDAITVCYLFTTAGECWSVCSLQLRPLAGPLKLLRNSQSHCVYCAEFILQRQANDLQLQNISSTLTQL